MTIKQAINVLRGMETYLCSGNPIWRTDLIKETVSMACEALGQANTPQTESTGSPIGDYRDGVGAWQTDCGWK